jgi:hypothetical protein
MWDDLYFSAPTNTTISVSLNGAISGSYGGSNYSQGVHLTAFSSSDPALMIDHNWTNASSGATSTGVLIGYDGIGPFPFTTPSFDVPTNTPVRFDFWVDCVAATAGPGTSSSCAQSVSFGSLAESGVAFNVPAGVTVNSIQAGIVDNGVVQDGNVYLDIDPQSVVQGDPLEFVTWNASVGSRALLFITAVNGSPLFLYPGLNGLIDADGRWQLPILVPALMEVLDIEFSTISLNTLGQLQISNPQTVTFQ